MLTESTSGFEPIIRKTPNGGCARSPFIALDPDYFELRINSAAAKSFGLKPGGTCNLSVNSDTKKLVIQLPEEGCTMGLTFRRGGVSGGLKMFSKHLFEVMTEPPTVSTRFALLASLDHPRVLTADLSQPLS